MAGNSFRICDDAVREALAVIRAASDRVCGRRLKPMIGRLRARGITAKALYYIRRHDQFLASASVQQVKWHGCTDPPGRYARVTCRQYPFQ